MANRYRGRVAGLTQGVAHGNNGVAQLRSMGGGMSNISQMLDRLKSLAVYLGSGAGSQSQSNPVVNVGLSNATVDSTTATSISTSSR